MPGRFFFIGSDVDFPTIHGIAQTVPKIRSCDLNSSQLSFLENLFYGILSGDQGFEYPLNNAGFRLFGSYILFAVFGDLIGITQWSHSHPATFFFRPPHPVQYVQGPAIILHFGCSKVKSQHHFVFWNRQVQRLFDGLRLDFQFPQGIDHLISIPGIAAKAVPFREKDIIDLPPPLS
ncbi:MAG TPA: hypothetical protein VGS79_03570 [Puia sp.]|nr:hypothetical protein [Puia sp.]